MVLGFVVVGIVTGGAAAGVVLCLEGGWATALLAYSLGGAGGIGGSAALHDRSVPDPRRRRVPA